MELVQYHSFPLLALARPRCSLQRRKYDLLDGKGNRNSGHAAGRSKRVRPFGPHLRGALRPAAAAATAVPFIRQVEFISFLAGYRR